MHHVYKPKLTFLGLLAFVFAAIMVPAAAAYPVLQDESNFVANTTKAPLVIPYLSQGVGVDQSLYSGTSSESSKAPVVIPYLSHGVGVDVSRYGGTVAQAPDAFERAVARRTAARPDDRPGIRGIGTTGAARSSASSSSTDWSTFLLAGGAVLAAMLLVATAVLLLNRRQHGRVLAH